MQTKLKTKQQEEYKETELGLLPKDWEVVRLGDVFTEVDKKMRKVKILPEKNYKIILTKLYAKGIQLKEIKSGKKISAKYMYSLRAGDFIFSKINLRKGSFDFVSSELGGAVVSTEHPILELDRKRANQNYIKFYFSQPFTWDLFKKEAKGFSGKERIKVREFITVKIPLPPLPEQKSIAFVLSTIQAAKEKTEQVIQATKELKKSLMKHLFTYGPVSLEDVEKVKLKETEIGMVPKEWEVVRLGDVAKISSGGSAPQGKHYFNGEYPFIRVQHIDNEDFVIRKFDLITDMAVKDYKLKLYPKGTIVFPKSGASVYLEKRAILPTDAYIVSHLCAISSKNKNILQNFLFYVLRYMKLAKKKADGYPTLNLSEVKQVKIPLPPLPIQQKIAEILSTVDEKIQAEENKKKALEELFKSMLHNLMTAKIRVKGMGVENG